MRYNGNDNQTALIYGWDAVTEEWIKVQVNTSGELIIVKG